jgi:hypothetical protein
MVYGGVFTTTKQSAVAHRQTFNKHYMNQMVAYKQQLEISLMMGL